MHEDSIDPALFYSSYPRKVITRPGYPSRAAYKSTLMFRFFGQKMIGGLGEVNSYADIGGAFGFGANSMAFQISRLQGSFPRTVVFEISPDFVALGRNLFPDIIFVEAAFDQWDNIAVFDLISLFDVVEHVENPGDFLRQAARRGRYLMLKTPMETSGALRGDRPLLRQGINHPEGHINFFTPRQYARLLEDSNLEIVKARLIPSIVPFFAQQILIPEQFEAPGLLNTIRQPRRLIGAVLRGFPGIPWKVKRLVMGGGEHLSLCRSRAWD